MAERVVTRVYARYRGQKFNDRLVDAILTEIAQGLRNSLVRYQNETLGVVPTDASYGYDLKAVAEQVNDDSWRERYAAIVYPYDNDNTIKYEQMLKEFEPTFAEVWQKVIKVAEALLSVWLESLDDGEKRAALLDMGPAKLDALVEPTSHSHLLEPYAEPRK